MVLRPEQRIVRTQQSYFRGDLRGRLRTNPINRPHSEDAHFGADPSDILDSDTDGGAEEKWTDEDRLFVDLADEEIVAGNQVFTLKYVPVPNSVTVLLNREGEASQRLVENFDWEWDAATNSVLLYDTFSEYQEGDYFSAQYPYIGLWEQIETVEPPPPSSYLLWGE